MARLFTQDQISRPSQRPDSRWCTRQENASFFTQPPLGIAQTLEKDYLFYLKNISGKSNDDVLHDISDILGSNLVFVTNAHKSNNSNALRSVILGNQDAADLMLDFDATITIGKRLQARFDPCDADTDWIADLYEEFYGADLTGIPLSTQLPASVVPTPFTGVFPPMAPGGLAPTPLVTTPNNRVAAQAIDTIDGEDDDLIESPPRRRAQNDRTRQTVRVQMR
ncbi:Uu.00g042490.m01.CDS01 [Anthostomella pinea]|uniref:Uu.00g042490.m01.CDS01 n=1 Tax=Anthostomella pinea TaxID=933095 RepID=A0AAI8VAL5_9PEZI|nr:Uu.00g042490.m01.CDS01 [Anthostomella pinea]